MMMIRDDDDRDGEKWHHCQVVPVELDTPWKTMLILRPLYQSPGDKTMPCQPLKTQWHTIISIYPIPSSAGWLGQLCWSHLSLAPARGFRSGLLYGTLLCLGQAGYSWHSPLTKSHACTLVRAAGFPLYLWWEAWRGHMAKAVETKKSEEMALIVHSPWPMCKIQLGRV